MTTENYCLRAHMQERSQPKNLGGAKNFGGSKMLDLRRITLLCLGYRLSKHKMAIRSENLGGPWLPSQPLASPMRI